MWKGRFLQSSCPPRRPPFPTLPLIIFFVFSRGVIPEDLKEIDRFKRILSEKELISYAKKWKGENYQKAVVLSIFFQEQGKEDKIVFWNNNASGMHPWGKRYPWGWAKHYWVRKPNGYVFLKEGKTKKICPYFSFHFLEDNFLITYVVIYDRGIRDYRSYCLKWAGGWYDYKSEYFFNERIRKFFYELERR